MDHRLILLWSILKKMRDKIYLISWYGSRRALQKWDKADIHVEIERTEIVSQALLGWDPEHEYTKDIELVANNTISPSVIALFKRTTFFLKTK